MSFSFSLQFKFDQQRRLARVGPSDSPSVIADGDYSTGTDTPVVSSMGYAVAVAEGSRNLHSWTEAFGASGDWGPGFNTTTENATTAPDGTVTADLVVPDAGSSNPIVSNFLTPEAKVLVVPSTTYTVSVHAKPAGFNWIALQSNGKDGSLWNIWFNVATGAVGTTDAGATPTIVPAANGFYRCALSFNMGAGANTPGFRIAVISADGVSTGGDGVSGAYLWGSQYEKGGMTQYQPVVANEVLGPVDTVGGGGVYAVSHAEGTATAADTPSGGVTFTVSVAEGSATAADTPSSSANVLRPSVAEGSATAVDTPSDIATFVAAAAEGSATAADTPSNVATFNVNDYEGNYNLLSFTESFDDARWTKLLMTVTANAGTDPFGGSTADKLIPTAAAGDHYVSQLPFESVGSGISMQGSLYAKAAGYSIVLINITNRAGTGSGHFFDLSTGIPLSSLDRMEDVGGGWYRCWWLRAMGTGGPVATSGTVQIVGTPSGSSSFTGNGIDGILAYGAQFVVASDTAVPIYASVLGEHPTLDTVTAGTSLATATVAEGSATAADTLSATDVAAATVAEGSATAADTSDGSTSSARVGRVAWVRFSVPESAGTIFSASVAEGSATAADTPNASAVFAASVAEGSATAADTCSTSAVFSASDAEGSATATDTPSAATTYTVSHAEGSATATDVPTAGTTTAASVAEGSATATDTPTASTTTAASVAEGSATAADTPTAGTNYSTVSVAEGTATAADSPSAASALAASVAEGSATATDTTSATNSVPASVAETSTAVDTVTADLNTSFSASVSEGTATATDTPSTSATYAGSVAESGSGLDTPSAAGTFVAAVAEGSATAVDTPSALRTTVASVAEISSGVDSSDGVNAGSSLNTVAESGSALDTPSATFSTFSSVVEGSATAQDTVNYSGIWIAAVAEAGSAVDTPVGARVTAASVTEGTVTAADSTNGDRQANAGVVEGSSTALDTQTTIVVFGALAAEGSGTAVDSPIAQGQNEASVFEVSSAVDTVTADVPDRTAERTPYYTVVTKIYVFTEPQRPTAVFTPVDSSLFKFTKPPVPEPVFDFA